MSFSGFPPEVFRFYADLERNNDRNWYWEYGYMYKKLVLPTMKKFIADLDPIWRPMTVYRPYRSVRFSPDKSPYKTAIGSLGSDEEDILHYIQLSGTGVRLARGYYMFSPDQLLRYYEAVDGDHNEDLRQRIVEVEASGLQMSEWEKLSGTPRGYPRDHPRADLLRWGGVTVSQYWSPDDPSVNRSGFLQDVQSSWTAAQPVTDWLAKHVGPPEL